MSGFISPIWMQSSIPTVFASKSANSSSSWTIRTMPRSLVIASSRVILPALRLAIMVAKSLAVHGTMILHLFVSMRWFFRIHLDVYVREHLQTDVTTPGRACLCVGRLGGACTRRLTFYFSFFVISWNSCWIAASLNSSIGGRSSCWSELNRSWLVLANRMKSPARLSVS